MTVELHYTVDGPPDAPFLVLGSSLGTTGALWQPQMPTLVENFRVLRYDHRGHGRSPVPQGPYAIEDLGSDVLALIEKLDAPKVHLGGLSLGGMVAMWVAAHAPERIDRLVLVGTSSRLGPPEVWAERAEAVRAGGMPAVIDAVLDRWFTPEFATRSPGVVAWARRLLNSTPPEGYAACCSAIEKMDLDGLLGRITAPTLAIAGADDPSTPPSHLEHIVRNIPNARLEVVADAAHMTSVQQPALVGRMMVDFLS